LLTEYYDKYAMMVHRPESHYIWFNKKQSELSISLFTKCKSYPSTVKVLIITLLCNGPLHVCADYLFNQ